MMEIVFVTDLILTVLNDKTYRLKHDFYVAIQEQEHIVPEGFETDLASVPRVPIVFELMGATGTKAAVLHDWLYATNMYPRKYCDTVFYYGLLKNGMGRVKAWLMYTGVRIGGASAYNTYTMIIKEQERKNGIAKQTP